MPDEPELVLVDVTVLDDEKDDAAKLILAAELVADLEEMTARCSSSWPNPALRLSLFLISSALRPVMPKSERVGLGVGVGLGVEAAFFNEVADDVWINFSSSCKNRGDEDDVVTVVWTTSSWTRASIGDESAQDETVIVETLVEPGTTIGLEVT